MHRQTRPVQITLAAIAATVGVYLVAGLMGAALVVNDGWNAPTDGIKIWVEDNGIHTDLVLPKRTAGGDWSGLFSRRAIRDPRYGDYDFVAVGWGERQFFVETPTWWDVRPNTVIAAAVGSDDTVLHVEHVARPIVDERVRRVVLTPAQYRRLTAFVWASLAAGEPAAGYTDYDAFYPAHGRYDALRTCNEWTGRALRYAGVRVGRWTPFPATVS